MKKFIFALCLLFFSNVEANQFISPEENLKPSDNTGQDSSQDQVTVEAEIGITSSDSEGLDESGVIRDLLSGITITPYGYIMLGAYWDTRQVFGYRDDYQLMWPEDIKPDVNGRDINARGQFDMSAIETTMGINIDGPEIWPCVKGSACLEGDFYGGAELSTGQFRLNFAYSQLDFLNLPGSLKAGQYYHPLVVIDCMPLVFAYFNGAPIECFSRNPQIRFTQCFGPFEFIAAAISQRDFQSAGPLLLVDSSTYLRNAVIPNMHAQLRFNYGPILLGVAGDFKRLVPRLASNNNYKVNEHIDSWIAMTYLKFQTCSWRLCAKFLYAQNANDLQMYSGYAVRTVNPVTDFRTYSNTAAMAGWFDGTYTCHSIDTDFGIFIGATKNLGSKHRLYIDPTTNQPIIYNTPNLLQQIITNLDSVFRISPRVLVRRDPIRFGVEIEYTRARFGKIVNDFARVLDTHPVHNTRVFAEIFYVF